MSNPLRALRPLCDSPTLCSHLIENIHTAPSGPAPDPRSYPTAFAQSVRYFSVGCVRGDRLSGVTHATLPVPPTCECTLERTPLVGQRLPVRTWPTRTAGVSFTRRKDNGIHMDELHAARVRSEDPKLGILLAKVFLFCLFCFFIVSFLHFFPKYPSSLVSPPFPTPPSPLRLCSP